MFDERRDVNCKIPSKLKPLVSVLSTATEFSISHFPTMMHVPHITVISMTVDPANKPIPTDT